MDTIFGGGLSRFRDFSKKDELNTCREIVEVTGESEWKIRKLSEIYDEFCWKYPGCSVIVNYYFNRLQFLGKNDDKNDLFYGKVSHFMSPVEISIQPKYLSKARKNLISQMNLAYSYTKSINFGLTDDQIFPSVACVVNESGNWYRAKILQVSGKEHVVVELVDFGTTIIINRNQICPLLKKYGKAPPLCLKCRVDGISINDLEIKDLLKFKKIIESCNSLFRVELKSTEEPFLINLFHPTLKNKNVCEEFFPPEENKEKQNRLDRNWMNHVMKEKNEFIADEDDYWNHHWDSTKSENNQNEIKMKFVKRLDKCARAPRFQKDFLFLSYIENSILIYAQYPWQFEKRKIIENKIKEKWNEFVEIPENLIKENQTCFVQIFHHFYYRVIIDKYDQSSTNISLFFIDHGNYLSINRNKIELKLIPNQEPFIEIPMVIVISLVRTTSFGIPHHSETEILRKFLKPGSKIFFKWDKKTKNTPLRGIIFNENHVDVSNYLSNMMLKLRQNSSCRQLDIYRKNDLKICQSSHVYRINCHQLLSKGNFETMEI